MVLKKATESEPKTEARAAVRATISFPGELYETLGVIAKQNKVSLAWVVREAAEQYVGEKWPLFKKQG
jgi:predicted DNA-binding protein